MSLATAKPRTKAATRKSAAAPERARYGEDFARWAFEQAALVRASGIADLDIENIAEELETLGRDEFNKLRSALSVLVMHMLTWDHQPQRRSRSWASTIRIQRIHSARQIEENPSLKPRRDEALADAYETARLVAADETGLPLRTFPAACPYGWEDVTERAFAFDPDDA